MEAKKPHIVCIPAPAQGHINPMIKLAMPLHSRGFCITFVHTEFNFNRIVKSLGSEAPILQGIDGFRFETIPDALPSDNKRGILDLGLMSLTLQGEPKDIFKALLVRLLASPDVSPVSCIISDAHMNFPFEIGRELGLRVLLLYTPSASAVLGFLHYDELVKRGLFPLKDESCLTDGFLETPVDWIPGLIKGAQLKHLPTFLRSTDPQERMFHYNIECARHAVTTKNIILNTFDDLEREVLEGIQTKIPSVSTVGPLPLLCEQAGAQNLATNMWKEDGDCIAWLDKQSPESVIYVNYGSLTIITPQQLQEFAWGLANSKHPFLWVIRNDLVDGETGILTDEYMEEINGRGFLSGWCPQEKVLKHPSTAVFLTHCGWNSTLESIIEGIPMICWPFFADQQVNCLYACHQWGIGVEIGEGNVKREKIEGIVREIMEGEKGMEMSRKATEWKKKAEIATQPGGSSYKNFDNLVKSLMENDHHC